MFATLVTEILGWYLSDGHGRESIFDLYNGSRTEYTPEIETN